MIRKVFIGLILSSLLGACASILQDSDLQEIQKQEEFDNAIKIEKLPVEEPPEVAAPQNQDSVASPVSNASPKINNSKKPSKAKAPKRGKSAPESKVTDTAKPAATKSEGKKDVEVIPKDSPPAIAPVVAKAAPQKKSKPRKKVPALEDSEGFDGRRPIVEPLRVGEKVTYNVSYFAVEAGKFDLSVKPFVQVNGEKAYHFHYQIKTSSLFSMFYAVDDVAETFVNYELWRPISYEIHVKESKQIKETKSYFDWKKMRGFLFEKKKVPDQSVENLKKEWDILQWSQNVFSVAFYLRTFTLKVGKTLKVRVGHEGKNLIMSAKVLRKEILDTPVGRFKTFVIRPTFEVEGIFKPTGDNLLWVTADDRKFILRVESKIKIGKIVSMVESLKKN